MTLADRFWNNVHKTESCWFWTGPRIKQDGYGYIRVDGCTELAHRVAWELCHQKRIPYDHMIVKTCPHSHCVRHTECKLRSEAFSELARARSVARGAAHYESKLNDELVREMRVKVRTGAVRVCALVRQLGLSYSTVDNAVKGKTWKHVEEVSHGS